MHREVLIALGAIILAAAMLYLEFGHTDPCATMTELATRYAAPWSEAELQAKEAEDDPLEAAVRRKRLEARKMLRVDARPGGTATHHRDAPVHPEFPLVAAVRWV